MSDLIIPAGFEKGFVSEAERVVSLRSGTLDASAKYDENGDFISVMFGARGSRDITLKEVAKASVLFFPKKKIKIVPARDASRKGRYVAVVTEKEE